MVEQLIRAIVKLDSFNDPKALEVCFAHAEREIESLEKLAQARKQHQGQEVNKGSASDRVVANNKERNGLALLQKMVYACLALTLPEVAHEKNYK